MTRQRRLEVRPGLLAWVALVSLGLAGVTRGNTITISPSSVGTVSSDILGNINFFNVLAPVFGEAVHPGSGLFSTSGLVFDLSFIPQSTVITSTDLHHECEWRPK